MFVRPLPLRYVLPVVAFVVLISSRAGVVAVAKAAGQAQQTPVPASVATASAVPPTAPLSVTPIPVEVTLKNENATPWILIAAPGLIGALLGLISVGITVWSQRQNEKARREAEDARHSKQLQAERERFDRQLAAEQDRLRQDQEHRFAVEREKIEHEERKLVLAQDLSVLQQFVTAMAHIESDPNRNPKEAYASIVAEFWTASGSLPMEIQEKFQSSVAKWLEQFQPELDQVIPGKPRAITLLGELQATCAGVTVDVQKLIQDVRRQSYGKSHPHNRS